MIVPVVLFIRCFKKNMSPRCSVIYTVHPDNVEENRVPGSTAQNFRLPAAPNPAHLLAHNTHIRVFM
jgi:hypothetical protein